MVEQKCFRKIFIFMIYYSTAGDKDVCGFAICTSLTKKIFDLFIFSKIIVILVALLHPEAQFSLRPKQDGAFPSPEVKSCRIGERMLRSAQILC